MFRTIFSPQSVLNNCLMINCMPSLLFLLLSALPHVSLRKQTKKITGTPLFFSVVCYWFLVCFHYSQTYSVWLQFFYDCWGLFYGPGCDLAWWMFHGHLKKNVHSAIFGSNVLCIWIRSCWLCCSDLLVSLLVSEKWVLKSQLVSLSVSPFSCMSFASCILRCVWYVHI